METHENSEQGQPLAVPLERPVRPDLADALAAYWDAAYAEGRDGRTHDTEDGAAQRALNSVHDAVRDLLAAERERWTLLLTEKWHAGDGKGKTLAQYMGMTDAEYASWVVKA